RARQAIDAALAQPARVDIQVVSAPGTGRQRLRIVPAPAQPADVLVARIDSPSPSRVTRGENAGHTLRHVDVARAFAVGALDARGEAALPALGKGAGAAGADARTVAVVFDRATGAALGARVLAER